MAEADRVIDLYQRRAHEWDRKRGRSLFEKLWLDRFIGLLPERGSVLDIGCGTGEPITRYLIGKDLAATGVDAAASMISTCRTRFPDHDWIVADMRTLSLGRRFDGLLAWDSFFHLRPEDQRSMFAVFAAHAAVGSALMFTSGPSYGHVIGELQGDPLYHASLDVTEHRSLLQAHGFSVVAHVVEDPNCGGHTVWLAQRSDDVQAARP